MSKQKHTPGPWVASGKGGTHDGGSSKRHPCFRGSIMSPGGGIVQAGCFLGVQGRTPKEAESNARLIAAAPELLEAVRRCEKIVSWCIESGNSNAQICTARNKARKAIAKAEGKA